MMCIKSYFFLSIAITSTGVSSEPQLCDLANHVAVVIPTKWRPVAIQLGLTMEEIRTIQKDEDDSFARFMAVLDSWQRSLRKPYTWNTLVTALKSASVDELKLAERLQQQFC